VLFIEYVILILFLFNHPRCKIGIYTSFRQDTKAPSFLPQRRKEKTLPRITRMVTNYTNFFIVSPLRALLSPCPLSLLRRGEARKNLFYVTPSGLERVWSFSAIIISSLRDSV